MYYVAYGIDQRKFGMNFSNYQDSRRLQTINRFYYRWLFAIPCKDLNLFPYRRWATFDVEGSIQTVSEDQVQTGRNPGQQVEMISIPH